MEFITNDIITPKNQQKLLEIQKSNPVYVGGPATAVEDIESSIADLERLILSLEALSEEDRSIGSSPGFDVRDAVVSLKSSSSFLWSRPHGSLYETLDLATNTYSEFNIPVPSVESALRCYTKVLDVWKARRHWAATASRLGSSYQMTEYEKMVCSCIRTWNPSKPDTLLQMANQVLEQEMVREASDCVTDILLFGEMNGVDGWNNFYSPESCPDPRESSLMSSSIIHQLNKVSLIPGRNEFVGTVVRNALAAKTSIDISTSYVFGFDIAHRYVLLDLIPYIAQKNGVNVRIMVDLITVESVIIKNAFCDPPPASVLHTKPPKADPTSHFYDFLPEGAPTLSDKTKHPPATMLDFFEEVLRTYANLPTVQLKWWIARDKVAQYRVKSHFKCYVFDKFATIVGGSNLVPTPKSAKYDCDLYLSGEVVKDVTKVFGSLWDQVAFANPVVDQVLSSSPMLQAIHNLEETKWNEEVLNETPIPSLAPIDIGSTSHSILSTPSIDSTDDSKADAVLLTELPHDCAENNIPAFMSEIDWDDANCQIQVLNSSSSSNGEDAILRRVLGAIKGAKESISMCFGHCNFPVNVCKALAEACQRGVHVKVLVNSKYSSDLRTGQKDMMRSLQYMKSIGPEIEIYCTAIASIRKKSKDEASSSAVLNNDKLPFIHAKYVVVDHVWSAVGGWNMWTRGAFYEFDIEFLLIRKISQRNSRKNFITMYVIQPY